MGKVIPRMGDAESETGETKTAVRLEVPAGQWPMFGGSVARNMVDPNDRDLPTEWSVEKGHIRAKAWPRGTSEPKEWTIEVEDPVPNHEGSPALYGYSIGIIENKTGSDLYYDNVSVTANKE